MMDMLQRAEIVGYIVAILGWCIAVSFAIGTGGKRANISSVGLTLLISAAYIVLGFPGASP